MKIMQTNDVSGGLSSRVIKNSNGTVRPDRHVHAFSKLYPNAWRRVDEFRAARGMAPLSDWPDWCFLPMDGFRAIVQESCGGILPIEEAYKIGILGALAAWRVTQGVYRFDQTVFESLWDTSIIGDIPKEVLYRLPEWCVYVEVEAARGKVCLGESLHGFFVHLEHDPATGAAELRLVLDLETRLLPIILPLVDGGLRGSLTKVREFVRDGLSKLGVKLDSAIIPMHVTEVANDIAPLVSLTLYLCSQAAEIRDASGRARLPARPVPKKTKKGYRTFSPNAPTTWQVAFRLGAALRRAYEAPHTPHQGGTHASPCPHIRRGHWHRYWTGPRSQPHLRICVLKWLPPIPVNVDDANDLIPVIRKVT